MPSKNRITLNDKALNRKEAAKLALEQGQLHEVYSDLFSDKYNGKIVTRSLVYELTGDRYLYIRDVDGRYGGKGNIFSKDYFERFADLIRRMQEDTDNGRNSNIAHWQYYSKCQPDFISHIPRLLAELPELSGLSLDYSTKSLDLLSDHVKTLRANIVFDTIYDHLVAYIGEVIRQQAKTAGEWIPEATWGFPVIASTETNVFYNPINIVWEEFLSVTLPDFRKAYGKELRNVGSQLSMERYFRELGNNTAQ